MKNNRSYRLPALLLAAMMVFGILPAAVYAETGSASPVFTLGGEKYIYDATDDARITFASGGQEISSLADLDPTQAVTMTVAVPAGNALPKDKTGVISISIPENVVVTNDDAAACRGTGVSCTYKSTTNRLEFRWTGTPKEGFTATLPVRASLPASGADVSGTWVLAVKNKNGLIAVIQPEIKDFSGAKRLTAVQGTIVNGAVYRAGTDLPEWKITRSTGDWYTISRGGLYLNFGKNGSDVSLTQTPQYFRYAAYGAGNQFVGYDDKGTRYYLNNKSNTVSNGIQASTYDDQSVALYKELKAAAGTSLVVFNVNNGSADSSLVPISVEKGKAITLPAYRGTRNGYNFLGWATRPNLKFQEYTQVYQPGESFTPGEDEVVVYAAWSSKTPERAQFGIRMSGDIPDEPAQHDASGYSKEHVYIDGTVINGNWVVDTNAAGKPVQGNHVANAVTANLKTLPSDDEIRITYPDYDPEKMYVHWYVLKYSSNMWKVDGVIVPRNNQVDVRYDANVATENKPRIKNIPAAYKADAGTAVTVGSGADGKKMKLPEYPEHIFEGWNTMADGSGQTYEHGAEYTVGESVTFYAQWTKIPTWQVTYTTIEKDSEEHRAGDRVVLPEAEEIENHIFAGWYGNGERIEGPEFLMPEEDVEITSVYYGPIDVEIVSDWAGGRVAARGTKIILTAIASVAGDIDLDYAYQWQYLKDGEWTDVEGATEVQMPFLLDDDTAARIWRVVITDAWPHRD